MIESSKVLERESRVSVQIYFFKCSKRRFFLYLQHRLFFFYFRSLTYIKHLDGDVSQLDLTFSVDHDVMGRLVTYELVPGGRALAVTNHNK